MSSGSGSPVLHLGVVGRVSQRGRCDVPNHGSMVERSLAASGDAAYTVGNGPRSDTPDRIVDA